MTHWIHGPFPGHEVNVIFSRGIPLETLLRGLSGMRREPIVYREKGGWCCLVHDMHNGEAGDYDAVDYRRLCPDGGEILAFVTEPCSAKAHGPWFTYCRDGEVVTAFSFENVIEPVGADPDPLATALAAGVPVGGDDFESRYGGGYGSEERIVRTISSHFGLPELTITPVEP
ncbi:hypothetical protein OG264_03640 [Streptomyces xanthophaeus]|uniref:hypothetical protein n=1 Tax=Streptomyces xanthophaeus TaxID=67385 RepID=UPI0038678951|nr:hypothetical protein OG264_03640 [Streptomyces xanthophaeus]WST64348.1 hypothetical protein OG605_34720 [Streptomyces xanthophaeus]